MFIFRNIFLWVFLVALFAVPANATAVHEDHHPAHVSDADEDLISEDDGDSESHATHSCGVCHHLTAPPNSTPALLNGGASLDFALGYQTLTGRCAAPPHQPPIG